jgi:opacity protein-like surface antigen
MNLVKTIAAGVVALSAMSTASFAADVIMPVMPGPAPIVVAPVVPQTWTGAYFGAFGAVTFFGGEEQGHPTLKTFGVIGGYDFQIGGRFVVGVNVRTGIPSALSGPLYSGVLDANMNGRAGALLGANQRLLAYATAGIGVTLGAHPTVPYWSAGGGMDFAATDRLHVFGEFTHARVIGSGAPAGNSVRFGVTLR